MIMEPVIMEASASGQAKKTWKKSEELFFQGIHQDLRHVFEFIKEKG